MHNPSLVIKIGGNELAADGFISKLTETIKVQQEEFACIVVHGGGRAIDDLMDNLSIEPQYHNGQRITDEKTLEIAEMVLSGNINKTLVFELCLVGLDAIGVSGIDRGLLQVEPWGGNMDLVGRIRKVRKEVILEYCKNNIVPVISPISGGETGKFNVNADHAAGKIAGAIKSEKIVFISNVPGVLKNDQIIPELTLDEVEEMIKNNIIVGGMIPKVRAALDALKEGTRKAMITNLAGFISQSGTTITI
ncbi:MAG: acetylglutamate kinase [Anaerolineaceae bacterium]|nr:acetylglutamate kinase [Anaerolineaceae bacterium]